MKIQIFSPEQKKKKKGLKKRLEKNKQKICKNRKAEEIIPVMAYAVLKKKKPFFFYISESLEV